MSLHPHRVLEPRRDAAAKLVARILLAGLISFHGVDKLVHGLAGVRHDIASAGLPSLMAYGVYLGEVIAPILLLIGVWTRLAALVLAGTVAFATLVAHAPD